MIIYLKNGAAIQTDDSLDKIKHKNLTNELDSIVFDRPKKGKSLYWVKVDEIIAIVDDVPEE